MTNGPWNMTGEESVEIENLQAGQGDDPFDVNNPIIDTKRKVQVSLCAHSLLLFISRHFFAVLLSDN